MRIGVMSAAVAVFGLSAASAASAGGFGFYYNSGSRYYSSCGTRSVVRYVEPVCDDVYYVEALRVVVSDCGPRYVSRYSTRYYSVPRYSRGVSVHYSSGPRYSYRSYGSPYRGVRVYRR